MKIVVQYDKKDILRLIEAAVKAQGLRIKDGTSIDFKGPLVAKFEIEVDDEPMTVSKPVAPPAAAAAVPTTTAAPAPPEEDDGDMGDVLQTNGGLLQTKKAPFERQLREGESYDFPRK